MSEIIAKEANGKPKKTEYIQQRLGKIKTKVKQSNCKIINK